MDSNQNDLLERYLQAVGQYLPAATCQDTVAELRANLLEQMDARAEELGRSLTAADVSEILLAHGRPEVVATRYLPQRSLIGPALFPTYLLTLRRAFPFVVVIYAVVESISIAAVSSSHVSAQVSVAEIVSRIVQAILGFFPSVVTFWAVVTFVFAAVEFSQGRLGQVKSWPSACKWDPTRLPALRMEDGTKTKSLSSRIADLIVHCLWMSYVLAIPAHPFLLMGPGTSYLEAHGVAFAPIWHLFFLLVLVLLFVQLAMKVLAIANQSHALLRPLQLVTDLLGVVTAGMMAFASEYFIAVSAAADLHSLASVNHCMTIAFRLAFAFAALGFFINGWKFIKRLVPPQRLAF